MPAEGGAFNDTGKALAGRCEPTLEGLAKQIRDEAAAMQAATDVQGGAGEVFNKEAYFDALREAGVVMGTNDKPAMPLVISKEEPWRPIPEGLVKYTTTDQQKAIVEAFAKYEGT